MTHLEIGNSTVVFALCGTVILFVCIQAFLFVKKAYARGIELNMSKEDMKRVMISSCIFSIVPSLPILLVLAVLMPNLGMYFPWLRLSVIGSGAYENMAANVTAQAFGLKSVSDTGFTVNILVAVMWVMTIGIIWGPLYTIFGTKYIQKGVEVLKGKQEKRFNAIFASMFIAMVCVFSGTYFAAPFKLAATGSKGLIPLLVLIVSALTIFVFDKIGKATNSKLIAEASFPLSMIIGMASAIVFNMFLV